MTLFLVLSFSCVIDTGPTLGFLPLAFAGADRLPTAIVLVNGTDPLW